MHNLNPEFTQYRTNPWRMSTPDQIQLNANENRITCWSFILSSDGCTSQPASSAKESPREGHALHAVYSGHWSVENIEWNFTSRRGLTNLTCSWGKNYILMITHGHGMCVCQPRVASSTHNPCHPTPLVFVFHFFSPLQHTSFRRVSAPGHRLGESTMRPSVPPSTLVWWACIIHESEKTIIIIMLRGNYAQI